MPLRLLAAESAMCLSSDIFQGGLYCQIWSRIAVVIDKVILIRSEGPKMYALDSLDTMSGKIIANLLGLNTTQSKHKQKHNWNGTEAIWTRSWWNKLTIKYADSILHFDRAAQSDTSMSESNRVNPIHPWHHNSVNCTYLLAVPFDVQINGTTSLSDHKLLYAYIYLTLVVHFFIVNHITVHSTPYMLHILTWFPDTLCYCIL